MNDQIDFLGLNVSCHLKKIQCIDPVSSESIKSIFCWFPLALFFLLVFSPTSLNAQRHEIRNVSFTVTEQNLIIVDYDLIGPDRKYVVELILRRKTSPVYSFKPQTMMGDVGKGKFSGTRNRIIWSPVNDTGEVFVMDPFVEDYYFQVRARRRNQLGGVWVSAIAVAAIIYFSN